VMFTIRASGLGRFLAKLYKDERGGIRIPPGAVKGPEPVKSPATAPPLRAPPALPQPQWQPNFTPKPFRPGPKKPPALPPAPPRDKPTIRDPPQPRLPNQTQRIPKNGPVGSEGNPKPTLPEYQAAQDALDKANQEAAEALGYAVRQSPASTAGEGREFDPDLYAAALDDAYRKEKAVTQISRNIRDMNAALGLKEASALKPIELASPPGGGGGGGCPPNCGNKRSASGGEPPSSSGIEVGVANLARKPPGSRP
jgi:hypothetical protein